MALPDWLDPLYTAEEMRAVDKWAIEEQGVPSLDLMERAGIGLARITAELATPGRPIRVVVGKGNNGGGGPERGRVRKGKQRRRGARDRTAPARGGTRGRRAHHGRSRRSQGGRPREP